VPENENELLQRAKAAFEYSYSPYSRFRVGAAIRTKDGTVFTGTNIENASLGLTICAERVAVFNAITNGHKSFTDLAIASSQGTPTFPCGSCRQVLYEFSPQIKIQLEGKEKEVIRLTELLPHGFGAEQIKQ
jgi:cytidine deaminase